MCLGDHRKQLDPGEFWMYKDGVFFVLHTKHSGT